MVGGWVEVVLYKNTISRCSKSLDLCMDSWVDGLEVAWLLGLEAAEKVALPELLRVPGLSWSKESSCQDWLLATTSWAKAEMMPLLPGTGIRYTSIDPAPCPLPPCHLSGSSTHMPQRDHGELSWDKGACMAVATSLEVLLPGPAWPL